MHLQNVFIEIWQPTHLKQTENEKLCSQQNHSTSMYMVNDGSVAIQDKVNPADSIPPLYNWQWYPSLSLSRWWNISQQLRHIFRNLVNWRLAIEADAALFVIVGVTQEKATIHCFSCPCLRVSHARWLMADPSVKLQSEALSVRTMMLAAKSSFVADAFFLKPLFSLL